MDKKSKCFIVSFLIVIMLVSLVSPVSAQAKTKLKLNYENYSGYCGESVQLILDRTTSGVSWTSTNKKIAIGSKTGVVKEKKAGECYIKATLTPTKEPTSTPPPTPYVTGTPTNVPLFNKSATVYLKDSLTKEEYEYHGDYYNSTYVESIEDLRPIINKTIATRSTYNFCTFVYSRRGALDDYSNQQAVLTKDLLLCKDETRWMDCYYNRGSYLFRTLDYDYQKMCGAGIDIIIFDKEFDDGDYSIYSIYGYADTTAAEFAQVQAKIATILPSINQGTTYDKTKNALDYLCDHIVYQNGGRRAQSAYGALIEGTCVCEGYASAYKLLLDAMGIPCEIVSTKSHAWNIVKIDEQWYHVDVTHCDQSARVYYKFMIGKDILYSNSDVILEDGYVIDSSTIKDYGYIDGSNQCQRELAESSYRP